MPWVVHHLRGAWDDPPLDHDDYFQPVRMEHSSEAQRESGEGGCHLGMYNDRD